MVQSIGNACTGCNACVAVCSVRAIQPCIDEKGFWYPKVDKTKCIECGICAKICPVNDNNTHKCEYGQSYVAWSLNDETRSLSSSGGIFSELASTILDDNGVVVGASLDINKNQVNHIIIDSPEEIGRLRGSKYVQSFVSPEVYKTIKKILDCNVKVLYSGTPCQIAGLKAYLDKQYSNLFTVEVVCHGVPSQLVLEKYLNDLMKVYKDDVKSLSFRSKENGWKKFEIQVKFKNKKYARWFNKDPFGKSFIYNMFLRECCYNCKFKDGKSCADITLGDFWRVSEHYDKDDKGCSLVIVNTSQGKEFFSRINKMIFKDEAILDDAIPGNYALIKSSSRFEARDEAFQRIKTESFRKVIRSYVNKNFFDKIIKRLRM